MRGCVGAWVRGCVGAWVRGDTSRDRSGPQQAWPVRGAVSHFTQNTIGQLDRSCSAPAPRTTDLRTCRYVCVAFSSQCRCGKAELLFLLWFPDVQHTSPEFRRSIALEHLEQRDDHSSAFPHRVCKRPLRVRARAPARRFRHRLNGCLA